MILAHYSLGFADHHQLLPEDCRDILNRGLFNSGVYTIYVNGNSSRPRQVYCDQDTADGGWMVKLSTSSVCPPYVDHHLCIILFLLLLNRFTKMILNADDFIPGHLTRQPGHKFFSSCYISLLL